MAATSRGTHALPNNSTNKNIENGKCTIKQEDREVDLCAEAKNRISKYASSTREKFNCGRKIQIKNIPPNLNTEDVEKFLKGYDVKEIKLSPKQAIVSLNDGSQADEIVKKLDGQLLNNTTVAVSVLPYTNLLCIAHLPKDFTNENFSGLIAKYSNIDWSFLMHFDDTDESLQYGLVKLSENADKNTIKEEFDWMEMEGCNLQAEYVENCTEYEKLFSRCLFIDNLPKTFKEAHRLRDIFNCVSNPIYCQIMVKDKESLGYGIIEYKQAWEAQETKRKLADYDIDGVKIRITFCIPEMQAVAIFNRFMYKTDCKSQTKGSLLPDPVMTNPLTINNPLVKGLALQNPELMNNFMQALQQLQVSYQTSVVSQSNKPGLLGPAPSLPLSPIMNPNMQLGLMIFLATQLNQQFTGPLAKQLNNLKQLGQQSTLADIKPSLLGDPLTAQANAVIQTLTNQVRGNSNQRASSTSSDTKKGSMPNILRNSRDLNINLLMNLGQIMSNLQNQNKSENLLSKNIQPPQNGNGLFPTPLIPNQNSTFPKKGIIPTVNGNSFSHNVQGNISKTFAPNSGPKPLLPNLSQQQAAPLMTSSSSKPTSLLGEPPAYLPKVSNMAGKGFSLGGRNDYQQPVRRSSESSSYSNRGSYSGQDYNQYNDSGYWADMGNESYYDDTFSDGPSNKLSKTDYGDLRKEDIYPALNTNTSNSNYSSQNHSGLQNNYQQTTYQQTAINYSSMNQSTNYNNNSLMDPPRNNCNPYSNSSSQLSNSRFSSKTPPSLLDNLDTNKNYSSYSNSYNPAPSMADYDFMKSMDYSSTSSSSYSSSYAEPGYDKRFRDSSSLYNNSSSYNSSNSSYLMKTPNSQKRSYSHLLPPPEPSPEGTYIGQHSQGLGGHYPDSYSKRIKLDSQFN